MRRSPLALRGQEHGSAYIAALLVLVLLTIFGMSLVLITSTERQIGTNQRTISRMFYNADSGTAVAIAEAGRSAPVKAWGAARLKRAHGDSVSGPTARMAIVSRVPCTPRAFGPSRPGRFTRSDARVPPRDGARPSPFPPHRHGERHAVAPCPRSSEPR